MANENELLKIAFYGPHCHLILNLIETNRRTNILKNNYWCIYQYSFIFHPTFMNYLEIFIEMKEYVCKDTKLKSE